jgi:transcriptional regulator with XRE-family HTH domain
MALRRNVRSRSVDRDDEVDLPRTVIDEITWYMRQHKVPRSELAQAMGVSPGRVSQILSGGENLTLRTLGSVVTALGARLDISIVPVDGPDEFADALA